MGIGDDCAISSIPSDCELVSCIDTLVAGRHFPLSTSAYAIGYKSVAVNLSDLAAMGATPYAILLGISLPAKLAQDDWLKPFTQGIADICNRFDVELIGGDTTQSNTLTISVTALGFVPTGQAITRRGAKVGDIICVSGEIGSASFALQQILNAEKSEQHNIALQSIALQSIALQSIALQSIALQSIALQPIALQPALDLPVPQVELGQKLRGFVHSMIDISDGLGQDLGHILTASQVGAVVDLASIPTHPRLQALPNTEKWQHQLNGGDDYQLCFTMSEQSFVKFNQQFSDKIFAIGKIVTENGLTLTYNNQPIEFSITGYQHF
ncbi:thiamine-phosphate kinase [Moraxella osloensis]|nr:thiamine-phosphate kinase [Moraxella osloensis]